MTYRIKKIKGADGFTAKPVDKQVSQWNAERDAKINSLHLEAEAFPPAKIYLRNDTHPRPHEVYNCTSCKRGGPNISADNQRFYSKCANPQAQTFGAWCEGGKWTDIGCPWFDRKIKIPYHGYMPGVEQ